MKRNGTIWFDDRKIANPKRRKVSVGTNKGKNKKNSFEVIFAWFDWGYDSL